MDSKNHIHFHYDLSEVINPGKCFIPIIFCKHKGKLLVHAKFCKIPHSSKLVRDWMKEKMIKRRERHLLSHKIFEDQCEN